MIRLQDIMAVAPVKPTLVRSADHREMNFRLGPLMDKVNRRSSNSTLLTTFDASHSGTIVNHRVYPGRQMKASQGFWLKPYPKPLLSNHPRRNAMPGDPEPDPYGRVRAAEYVQFFSEEKLRDDWKHPSVRDQGSGFSKTQIGVTHPKAIEDILTERLLTVSAGMDTNHLFCSACGSDWARAGGRCDHMPGQQYRMEDGELAHAYGMYFVTGLLYYDHLAKVNTPAQPYSTVLNHSFMDCQDSDLFESGQLLDGRVMRLTLIDSRDGPLELMLADSSNEDPTSSWKDEDWAEACVLDTLLLKERIADQLLEEARPKVEAFRASDRKPSFGKPRFAVGPGGSILLRDSKTTKAALDLVGRGFVKGADRSHLESRILECADSFEPIQVGGSTMTDLAKKWEEVRKMADGLDVADDKECDWSDFQGDLFDLAREEGEAELRGVQAGIIAMDAKLTTEKRKSLPDSAFCGPDRSFPAHDAAHVRNALSRLPQAKSFTSEQKARILACVKSRAKKLGVDVSGKGNDDGLSYEALTALWDKGPGSSTELDDPAPPKGETEAQKASRLERQLDSAKAKIMDQDATIQKLLDEQKNLQGELKRLFAKRVFDLRSELKKPDVVALDSEAKKQEFLSKICLRTVTSLRDSIQDLEAELSPSSTTDPRAGSQTQDPTATLQDGDKGGKLKDDKKGKNGQTDDSPPEDRFAHMLSGSSKK